MQQYKGYLKKKRVGLPQISWFLTFFEDPFLTAQAGKVSEIDIEYFRICRMMKVK
jgi:hypothetical protein